MKTKKKSPKKKTRTASKTERAKKNADRARVMGQLRALGYL